MKRILGLTLGLLVVIMTNGQVTVKADGKEVESLSCGMKNVHLSFTLPANYKNYEKIEVAMQQYAPEIQGNISYVYGTIWTSGYFDGKSTIEVDLIDKKGNSDLTKGALQYSMEDICFHPMRSYSYLENHFYINGAVHSGWEWKDGEKVKKYTYETIKEYTVKFTIGPVPDFHYGAKGDFTFDKVDFGEVEFSHWYSRTFGTFNEINESAPSAFDMGAPAPKAELGEVKLVAEVFNANEQSIEKLIKGVEVNLIQTSNASFQLSGYEIPFDHQSTFYAKQTYLPVTPGGKKGGKLSKAQNEEKVKALAKSSENYFDWKDAKLGDLAVKKLEIDVYDGDQVTTNDAWATYVKSDENEKTRKLIIYIGEKGGKIYCVALYKTLVEGLTDEEMKFIKNFEKTFKAL